MAHLRVELDQVRTQHLLRDAAESRDDLLQRLEELRRAASSAGIWQYSVAALSRTAEILLDSGRACEALGVLDFAMRELRDKDAPGWLEEILRKQAHAYASLTDWRAVSKVCERGIAIVERSRMKVTPFGLQSAYLRFRVELYQLGVRAAIELGDYALGLRRAELAKCVTSRRLGQHIKRDRAQLASVMAEYRRICEQMNLPHLSDDARKQLVAKRRALWDSMTISRFRDERGCDQDVIQAVQASLLDDEAVLYYLWLDQRELAVFLITREGIDAKVQTYSEVERAAIDRIPHAVLDFQDTMGELIRPSEEHLNTLVPASLMNSLRGMRKLFISPHRNLHLMPFHAFPHESGFWVDSFTISYLPNLNPLLTTFVPATKPTILALGVPQSNAIVSGHRVTPLKNVGEEIADLANLYGRDQDRNRFCEGPDATETQLRKLDEQGSLRNFHHLHFACHGTTVDSDSPMESSLILHDSALDGLDIAGLELDADVVVLSACCSGQRPFLSRAAPGCVAKEELPGDELFGLQAAFFSAGARQIVSTLWPVDSIPAREITRLLHKGMLSGMLPDQALQLATLEFRRTTSLFYKTADKWAPFFLVSLARPSRAKGV